MSFNTTYSVRLAEPADNDQLIALAKACPQRGNLQMYSDRFPDYFAMNRIQSQYSRIFVAESDDGKIIASVSLAEKEQRFKGRDIKVLHICDIRTHPDYRRTRVAADFIALYERILLTEGYDHGIAEILEGNQAIIKAHKYLEQSLDIRSDGHVHFSQLAPLMKYRVPKSFIYRQASSEDIPEIVNLLNKHYDQIEGFPRASVEWLEGELKKHPTFQVSNLWLAIDKQGGVAACAGSWNQHSIRRTVPTRFTPSMKKAVRALALLGLIWKLPKVPMEGEALQYSYIRFPVGVDPLALNALLKFMMNRIRRDGKEQFAVIGFHENDPMKMSISKMVKVVDRMHIFSHWPKSSGESREASEFRFVDLATI